MILDGYLCYGIWCVSQVWKLSGRRVVPINIYRRKLTLLFETPYSNAERCLRKNVFRVTFLKAFLQQFAVADDPYSGIQTNRQRPGSLKQQLSPPPRVGLRRHFTPDTLRGIMSCSAHAKWLMIDDSVLSSHMSNKCIKNILVSHSEERVHVEVFTGSNFLPKKWYLYIIL